MGALLAGHWATRPQIWVSGKRSGNYLSSKANLSAFLQICCSDFTLKLRQRSSSYKNCQKKRKKKKIKSEVVWDELGAKDVSGGDRSQGGAGSGFRLGWHTAGGVRVLFFAGILLVLAG